jgi:hypothetical protein
MQYLNTASKIISSSLIVASLVGCGATETEIVREGSETNQVTSSVSKPSLGLTTAEICSRLGSVYNVVQGPTWVREKGPILPTNFWLTSNERIKLGTSFKKRDFACIGNQIVMHHIGHFVYGVGGFLGIGERLEKKSILQKDVFTVHSDGSVTDEVFFEGQTGQLEKSEFALHVTSLQFGKVELGGTIPFPLPLCPLAIGVKDFNKCELRLNHKAEVVKGHISGYDGWTLVALDKSGKVAKNQVQAPTLSLSSDRSRIFK